MGAKHGAACEVLREAQAIDKSNAQVMAALQASEKVVKAALVKEAEAKAETVAPVKAKKEIAIEEVDSSAEAAPAPVKAKKKIAIEEVDSSATSAAPVDPAAALAFKDAGNAFFKQKK